MTDLSTGLCVGDLTFTDRPASEQSTGGRPDRLEAA